MTRRALTGVVVAVVVILLGCSGLTGMAGGGRTVTANCLTVPGSRPDSGRVPAATMAGRPQQVEVWGAEQVANAGVIVAVGRLMQVPAPAG
ncbi:hypothetical protein [Actinoplanes sp. M2I2]|uniref:hypothetical protein n=1 Tax=Actinoplanes sp. M2I2 TaxID=1734444 RepID=UPI0020204973|nr:hypothetical protein [Actinoplanes sp. M2I2]